MWYSIYTIKNKEKVFKNFDNHVKFFKNLNIYSIV
jgi:hypothetical protein